jgi:pimeloyl-ACP methyl ester carboxylesterase
MVIACVSARAFAQGSEPYRPLVFVPGILGSELKDENGDLVWGGLQSLRRFEDLEITDRGPVKQLSVGGLVRNVSILGPLWTIHQYDGLLKTLDRLGYREGKTLFVFPYDWRYSNFDTAKKLKAFIDAEPRLRNQKFDLLAHSMGGLVSRIYMQNLGGAARVERFISLGVPAQGAMNALATMSEGWGSAKNFLAGGIGSIRRVIFSFPAFYELFPSYDKCCRIGSETGYTLFDPTDINVWTSNNWLPPEHTGARLALVEQALQGARQIRALTRQPLPTNVEAVLIAGDRIGTYLYVYVDPNDHDWKKWRFSKSRGDGTVPVWSAANANLAQSLPAFVDHATIFDDKWVTAKLEWMLNRNAGPPPVSATNVPIAVTKSGKFVEVALADVMLDPPVAAPGDQLQVQVAITLVDEVARDDLAPGVSLDGAGEKRELPLQNITNDQDLEQRVLRFVASAELKVSGNYTVHIAIPGVGSYSRDLLVVEQR